MFARSGRRRSAAGLLLAAVLALPTTLALSGCAEEASGPVPNSSSPNSSSQPSSPNSASPVPTPSVTPVPPLPAGSVSLASLGFTNGPVQSVYIPSTAIVTDRVDQPNAVTVVFARPSAAELLTYFQQALPAGGFTIDQFDPQTATLTFSGHGWSGAFTGSDTRSALFLRPA